MSGLKPGPISGATATATAMTKAKDGADSFALYGMTSTGVGWAVADGGRLRIQRFRALPEMTGSGDGWSWAHAPHWA